MSVPTLHIRKRCYVPAGGIHCGFFGSFYLFVFEKYQISLVYCYLILVIRCTVTWCLQKGLELPGAVYHVHSHDLERKFIKKQRVINSYVYLKEKKRCMKQDLILGVHNDSRF